MFRRFAAGCTVGCIAIAVATLGVVLVPGIPLQKFSVILALWCAVPCVWGLWAMAAPAAWVPQKLPWWGAVLGAIAGFNAVVFNLPYRFFELSIPLTTRAFAILLGAVIYYLLWSVVEYAYKKLPAVGARGI